MEAYPNLKNWLDTDVCALKKKKKKRKREEEEGRTPTQRAKRATCRTLRSRDPILWFCSVGIRKTEAKTDEISVGGRIEGAHPRFTLQPSFDIVAVVPSAR